MQIEPKLELSIRGVIGDTKRILFRYIIKVISD